MFRNLSPFVIVHNDIWGFHVSKLLVVFVGLLPLLIITLESLGFHKFNRKIEVLSVETEKEIVKGLFFTHRRGSFLYN